MTAMETSANLAGRRWFWMLGTAPKFQSTRKRSMGSSGFSKACVQAEAVWLRTDLAKVPTRTMTAEALATRLLIGESVPETEIAEAERFLMQQPPGIGVDNYYYWYYATLALHQLQDDAWRQWNAALQRQLLSTQQPNGRWSSNTVWGGYGGEIYTTSMAALCLETYYRQCDTGKQGTNCNASGNAELSNVE